MRARLDLFIIGIITMAGCQESAAESRAAQVVFSTPKAEVAVDVEVAATDRKRAVGLMQRKQLGANAGMVFVFPSERRQSFWMKNTLIPLDMIFITANHVVAGVVHDAEPLTLDSRSVPAKSKFVVEVNGGFAKKWEITAGTKVRMIRVPQEPRE